jgi:hypothetical protein
MADRKVFGTSIALSLALFWPAMLRVAKNKKTMPINGLGSASSFLFPKLSAVDRSAIVAGRSSDSRITLLARTFPLGYAKQCI